MSAVDDAREDVDAAWADLWHDVANGEWSEVGRVDHHQRAIEAALRTGTLDVERLARAIAKRQRRSYVDMIDTLAAKEIAAEYARLTEAEK